MQKDQQLLELIAFCHGWFSEETNPVFPEEVLAAFQKTQEDLDKSVDKFVDDNITQWLELFPRGIKSGGKLVRSDKAGCAKKMKKFIKDTGYGWDIIMKATKDYLEEKERNNWEFCYCSTYLINKEGRGSELAALCENALTEDEEQLEYRDSNKGDFI